MCRRCQFTILWVIAAVIAPGPAALRAEEDAAGVRAAGRLLGAVLEAVANAEPAAADKEPAAAEADPRALARRQREQQIAQQAKQMEQFFQPPLQAELELVRRTCGGLAPAARRQVVAAGGEAVQSSAKRFAAQQFGERGKTRFDPRESIHEAVAAAVKPHAKPEEFAAYEREHAARQIRRERAARLLMIVKLDQELELSSAQRQAIEADLEKRWQAGWIRDLDDNGGMMINNHRPAPDFADASIAPHLDDRQRTQWKQWCQQAGWSRFGGQANWNFDGQSLQPDPWWAP
ncbi:MAG: hypothetical protein ACKOC4_12370 [Planctomycetia bacterium]